MMQLRYGPYSHAAAECTISIVRKPLFNEGGESYGFEETWRISGFLQAANQAAITAAIAKLQNAYSVNGLNLGFFDDNNQPTAHGILSKDTLDGVRIISGPDFERGESSEYTSYRYYSITAQWIVPDPRPRLLAFRERLSFRGTGGPLRAWMPVLDGPPPRQILRQFTTIQCSQSGMAIGWQNPVPPMPPLFPLSEHVDRRVITENSPERYGPIGAPRWAKFAVDWSYEFEDLILFGRANRWID